MNNCISHETHCKNCTCSIPQGHYRSEQIDSEEENINRKTPALYENKDDIFELSKRKTETQEYSQRTPLQKPIRLITDINEKTYIVIMKKN